MKDLKASLSAFSDKLKSIFKPGKSSKTKENEEKPATFLAYLKSRSFLVNLLLILSVYLTLFLILMISLNLITQHNKEVSVPDFNGYSLNRAKSLLASKDLEYVVFDSIYREDLKSGVIIDQHPKANAKVKKGRKVYFTINARSAGQIPMPDLIGLTFRAAQPRLLAAGLKLGNLRYRYDMAVNEVLDMEVFGEPIEPGETIMKGTPIDLVLGKGLGSDRVPVPNLTGLTYEEAQAMAAEAYFTTSTPISDETVSEENPIIPFVYKQLPESSPGNRVQLGTQIILWTTTDSTKVLWATPDSLMPDTTALIYDYDLDYEDDDDYDMYLDSL